MLPCTAVRPATFHAFVSLPNSINNAVLTSLAALFMTKPPGTKDSRTRQRNEKAAFVVVQL